MDQIHSIKGLLKAEGGAKGVVVLEDGHTHAKIYRLFFFFLGRHTIIYELRANIHLSGKEEREYGNHYKNKNTRLSVHILVHALSEESLTFGDFF